MDEDGLIHRNAANRFTVHLLAIFNANDCNLKVAIFGLFHSLFNFDRIIRILFHNAFFNDLLSKFYWQHNRLHCNNHNNEYCEKPLYKITFLIIQQV